VTCVIPRLLGDPFVLLSGGGGGSEFSFFFWVGGSLYDSRLYTGSKYLRTAFPPASRCRLYGVKLN